LPVYEFNAAGTTYTVNKNSIVQFGVSASRIPLRYVLTGFTSYAAGTQYGFMIPLIVNPATSNQMLTHNFYIMRSTGATTPYFIEAKYLF
jgi:hypothetical protein